MALACPYRARDVGCDPFRGRCRPATMVEAFGLNQAMTKVGRSNAGSPNTPIRDDSRNSCQAPLGTSRLAGSSLERDHGEGLEEAAANADREHSAKPCPLK